jgi:hypothetical protein
MFVAGLEIPAAKQDPFHSLVVRLRELLSARPKGLVWDKNRGSAFNILLVDKVMYGCMNVLVGINNLFVEYSISPTKGRPNQ